MKIFEPATFFYFLWQIIPEGCWNSADILNAKLKKEKPQKTRWDVSLSHDNTSQLLEVFSAKFKILLIMRWERPKFTSYISASIYCTFLKWTEPDLSGFSKDELYLDLIPLTTYSVD